jgi:hypothetical protein
MAKRFGRYGSIVARKTRDQELEDKIPGGGVTPELKRHADVENEVIAQDKLGFATVVRQRIRNRFMSLGEDGTLSSAEVTAALQLRLYADAYFSGVTVAYKMKVDGSPRPEDATINKLHYAQVVQGALDYLNPELRKVAISYILEGIVPGYGHTFLSIGEQYYPQMRDEERKRIAGKTLVIAACRELAVYFKYRDGFKFDIAAGITGIRVGKIRSTKSRLLEPVLKVNSRLPEGLG